MNALTTKAKYFFDRLLKNNALLLVFIVLLFLAAGLGVPGREAGKELLPALDNPALVLTVLLGIVMAILVITICLFIMGLHHVSSHISPKIVLALVNRPGYQAVLGFYVGTVLYLCLVLYRGPAQVPALALGGGLCCGLISLGVLIYFVYSIAGVMYGRGVVYDIYRKTRKQLDQAIKGKQYILEGMLPQTSQWQVLASPASGYLQGIARQGLLKHGFKVQVLVPMGTYIVQGAPLLKVESNGRLNEKISRQLLGQCKITLEKTGGESFAEGFSQLADIAVKSISANDMDTAIHCIDCLTDLFRLRSRFADHATLTDGSGEVKGYIPERSLKELVYLSLAPIRESGKSNARVLLSLLNSLNDLMGVNNNKRNHSILLSNAAAMIDAAKKNIDNPADREKLNTVIEAINANANTDRYLHYLKSPVMAGSGIP